MVTQQTRDTRAKAQRLHGFAKHMRHRPSDAERKFWYGVRDRRFAGHKFRRQYPIGPYVADFICIECRLIVEIDGDQHGERRQYDAARDVYLASRGFRVLRFGTYDVYKHLEPLLDCLEHELSFPSPPPGERAG